MWDAVSHFCIFLFLTRLHQYFNHWRAIYNIHQSEYSEVAYEMPAHHQNTLGDRNTPWQDFMKDVISSFWLRNSCSCNLLWLARRSVSAWISFSLADLMAFWHSSVISTFKTVASARVTARQNAKTAISMLSVAAFIAITISVPSLRALSLLNFLNAIVQVAYGLLKKLKFIIKVSLLLLDLFLFVDFFDKITIRVVV